ncbi:MAG: IPT/TIG domain-containing protein [Planctomycetota bacterium]
MKWPLGLLAALGMSLGAASASFAQGLIYVWDGEGPYDAFGAAVSSAGDVDRDGHADLIVGAWGNNATGVDVGRAYVYRGQTGALLYSYLGEAPGDRFGIAVAGAGDTDQDGYDDYIVGAWKNDAGGLDAGRAYLYSGQLGVLARVFTGEAAEDGFGYSVGGAGDVDKDGYDDVVVGAFMSDAGGSLPNAGRAYVYSGRTGALLYTFTGTASGDLFGQSVDSAGDFNGDGYSDVVVGAPYNDDYGADSGRAYVFSGATGSLLAGFSGQAVGDSLGWSVAGVGDANKDGKDDVVAGALYNDVGGPAAGRAYVFAGDNGSLLHILTGEAGGDQFGVSVAGMGDYDQDGYDDIAVGAWQHDGAGPDSGGAYVYSGRTGLKLFSTNGEAGLDRFGCAVASAGDVDRDGSDDLIVGAIFQDSGGTDAGRAYVYSGTVAPVVFSVEPARTYFSEPEWVTIYGDHFSLSETPTVLFGAQEGTNVVVVDDDTITCDVPPWTERGPVEVRVRNVLGDGILADGFSYTPALLLTGTPTPGGAVELHFLVASGDSIFAIHGLPPEVDLPVGLYIGSLHILPFGMLFYIANWPFDELASGGNIPNDPALSGVEILIQGLVGHIMQREGAWTNCAHLLIQ